MTPDLCVVSPSPDHDPGTCDYCTAQRGPTTDAMRTAPHCPSCGFDSPGFARCDACQRWADGERLVVDDHDLLIGFAEAVVDMATRDLSARSKRSHSGALPCSCGDDPTLCSARYLDALRTHALATQGGDIAHVILTTEDRIAA